MYIVCCGYLFQHASSLRLRCMCVIITRVRDVPYTLQTLVSMLVDGRAFDGTVDYPSTDMRLQLRTRRTDTTSISKFLPVVFPDAQTVYKLLFALHELHICCFLTGSFVLYVAGRLDMHDGLLLIVALVDYDFIPVLRWLMQADTTPSFTIIDTFQFTLLDNQNADRDLQLYSVSCDDDCLF